MCGLAFCQDYLIIASMNVLDIIILNILRVKLVFCTCDAGHTSRVLHMAMSPDGSTVVSAAADETLRLWKCFAVDPRKKDKQSSSKKDTNSSLKFHSLR